MLKQTSNISFAQKVKEEINAVPWIDECKRSLLASFIKINGSLRINNGSYALVCSSEYAKTAKTLYSFISSLFGINVRFSYTKGMGFHQRVNYHVICDDPDYVLGDLSVDFLDGAIPNAYTLSDELIGSYLAGAFLASGSVNDPKSSNYHLEITTSDESYAKSLSRFMNKINGKSFQSKVIQRRKKWVIYLKRSEQISDFLVLIGATNCCLEFENVRIDRDFSNVGNRLYNLDSSNLKKTMQAGTRQKNEIDYLLKNNLYLPEKDSKIAWLMQYRLCHEDATLDEIAQAMSEALSSTISKSNINHLFRKIHELYEKAK